MGFRVSYERETNLGDFCSEFIGCNPYTLTQVGVQDDQPLSADQNCGGSLSLEQRFLGGCSLLLGTASHRQEQLEFWGELVFGVQPVGEIDSANTAVSVNLHSKHRQWSQ